MKKVLIVDDAKDSRSTIKAMLRKLNVEICEAENGREGWKKILTERPDIIILDLYMPEKDGFDVLKDIEDEWMGIPVVVISNDSAQSTIDSCLRYGASAYLKKPLNPNEFISALNLIA